MNKVRYNFLAKMRQRKYMENPANREANRIRCAAWREKNADYIRGTNRAWKLANPTKVLDQQLWSDYGITLAGYDELLLKQGGVCAICGQLEKSKRKARLSVDHNHITGAIRGLLCAACNAGLGHFTDSPSLLRRAAGYLKNKT